VSVTYVVLVFWGDVVWCVVQSVTYIVLVFFWRRCLVRGCYCYLYLFRVLGGKKKMVQRIVEVVADYEDRVNLTGSSAPAT
jgi:hypothetical protein